MNILISPLNWGIGHASRLVPIIKFLKDKHNLTIAANGNSYFFLKNEFNDVKIIKSPKFDIKYTKNPKWMPVKIFFSLPKLIIFYIKNQLFVKNYIKKNKTDFIISDNCFGFFSKKIKSVFITHQVNISIPDNLKFLENSINKLNRINIEKFDECWIPDNESNISGKLSYIEKLKIPSYKIGLLSRFNNISNDFRQENFDVVCLISGPEPQRSIFEDTIKQKLKKTNYKTLILRGIPINKNTKTDNNVIIKNHSETKELKSILKNAEIIIARAGYSTIMDLVSVQKSAIIVPTPGQTEQEYLADYLHYKKLFFKVSQKQIQNENFISEFITIKTILENNLQNIKTNHLEKFLNSQFTE